MEIPRHIEAEIDRTARHHLETELGACGLLLSADVLIAVHAEQARRGQRLLAALLDLCYPVTRAGPDAFELRFATERDAERLCAVLAFGAATAALLVPDDRTPERTRTSLELMCAAFNLVAGLLDSLCDANPDTGLPLLDLLRQCDLPRAAQVRRRPGWLRSSLPSALNADPAVTFLADVLEAFFSLLHDVYHDEAWMQLRRAVGAQLHVALTVERESIRPAPEASRERLIECSRGTSVVPFQIMQTLARGESSQHEPTAGTCVGEALWWIDDLIDICQDARVGALNGVLLSATAAAPAVAGEEIPDSVVERLLSTELPRAASRAAHRLHAGFALAGGLGTPVSEDRPARALLHFIQRYAGIAPRRRS